MADNSLHIHGYSMHSDLVEQAHNIFGESKDPIVARKVYQLVFAGYDGSTFPFAFWPVRNWNSQDVLGTALEAIEMLRCNNFNVCIKLCK